MAGAVPDWIKALGQSAFHAVATSNPVQAVHDGTPRRIMDHLGQWFAHLSQNALIEWTPALVRNERCSFCEEGAIGRCMCCKDFTCLGHAHVSHRAELLCDECVGRVLDDGESARRKTPEQLAFAYFHLTEEATLEEVKASYRVRALRTHPDQGGSDSLFQEASEKLKVLEKYFSRGRS